MDGGAEEAGWPSAQASSWKRKLDSRTLSSCRGAASRLGKVPAKHATDLRGKCPIAVSGQPLELLLLPSKTCAEMIARGSSVGCSHEASLYDRCDELASAYNRGRP